MSLADSQPRRETPIELRVPVAPDVAILDIALVLIIFKGDVRLR